jgi:hypothetical protein
MMRDTTAGEDKTTNAGLGWGDGGIRRSTEPLGLEPTGQQGHRPRPDTRFPRIQESITWAVRDTSKELQTKEAMQNPQVFVDPSTGILGDMEPRRASLPF